MKKKIFTLLLSLFILSIAAITVKAEEYEGEFALTVCTANNIVIEPTMIPYKSGQTVRDALLATDYEFSGLEEQDFIYSVEGVTANYYIMFDNGDWNFNIPASEVYAVRIGVVDVHPDFTTDMSVLIETMAEFNALENHVQNYQEAYAAYQKGLAAIRGDGAEAGACKELLISKEQEYETLLAGEKYTVSVDAFQGDETVANPIITMIDSYGNITTATGSSIRVIAGTYTYSVSDGKYNRTEGSLTVTNNTSLTVILPYGEWFGDMSLRSYDWLTGFHSPYYHEIDKENHKVTFWVDDTASGYYGTNLVVYAGDLPDENTTYLRTIFTSVEGVDYSTKQRNWAKDGTSYGNYLDCLVSKGMEGRVFSLEAQYVDANGGKEIQSYEVTIVRIPSLSDLAIEANGTPLSLENDIYTQSGSYYTTAFESGTRSYSITTVSDRLTIKAKPFDDGYTVLYPDEVLLQEGTTDIEISVSAPNGETSTYTVSVLKTGPVEVIVNQPAGTSVEVFDQWNTEYLSVDGKYNLVPGKEYTCIATKNLYYHTKKSFVAAEGLAVDIGEPITEDWISDMVFGSGYGRDESGVYGLFHYETNKIFAPEEHTYSGIVSDSSTTLYIQANAVRGKITAIYPNQTIIKDTTTLEITYPVEKAGMATFLTRCLSMGGFSNTVVFRVEDNIDDETYYQDYFFTAQRKLSLKSMTLSSDNETITLQDNSGNAIEYDRDIFDYYTVLDRDLEAVNIDLAFPNSGSSTVEDCIGGYTVTLNGETYASVSEYSEFIGNLLYQNETLTGLRVPLDTEKDSESVEITIQHKDPSALETTYRLHFEKTKPVEVLTNVTPADTVISLTDSTSGKRVFEEDGKFLLTPGKRYLYTATYPGYMGVEGEYVTPQTGGVLEVILQKSDGGSLQNLSAQWPHFRVDKQNNAVISSLTPKACDEGVLYWAQKLGDGYDSGACSPPILVDGYLYCYAGDKLYKLDPLTGTPVSSSQMAEKSSFAINPPTYAEGMIFVGLSGGKVQAFNAATLDSLWVYTDELGGQPNNPIVYHNGMVYTGFWLGESEKANYVCLTATDEDPNQSMEKKLPSWTYTSEGGFYWAGAYVCNDYLLIGTDDGKAGANNSARLLSFEPRTGKLLDEALLSSSGDVRSSIVSYNGGFYFTSKGGQFYKAEVTPEGSIATLFTIALGGMSTSTPVIYNNRAYVGVCGSGQFKSYSGHHLAVIDLNYWEIAYSVQTKGYPQTSGVLTTAYENSTGSVFVYFFDNFTPGILRVLEDQAGRTTPAAITTEGSYSVAYNLFEPVGEHAQFALCSPVVDEFGTIYFKNDSGFLMAFGSTIESLSIIQQPDKTVYQAGETFDPTGLKVVANYKNGLTRDVTQFLKWSEEPLTKNDTDFQLIYPIIEYQNAYMDNGTTSSGVEYVEPIAVLPLTINSIKYGDVNGDKRVDMKDARLVVLAYAEEIVLTEEQKKAADVDGNKKVNMVDKYYIVQYYAEEIAKFPVEDLN